MRVLVTGGTGLLGWWLVKVLTDRGFDVFATYHDKKPVGLNEVVWLHLDLEKPDTITRVFDKSRPDVVIHSAAYADVDGCEIYRNRAYLTNYIGTLHIARLSKRHNSYLVYISTDYVFDGSKGIYKEEDEPYPINYYGLSKLLGEVAVSSLLNKSGLVVRVSGLYGYSPTGKRNFGITVLDRLLRGEAVYAFVDQFLSPTYVPFLAERIVKIIERQDEFAGVVHLAGDRLSRYEFAMLVASNVGAKPDLVVPTSIGSVRFKAKRPKDSSLDTSKAQIMNVGLPPQEESIKHFIGAYRSMIGLSY